MLSTASLAMANSITVSNDDVLFSFQHSAPADTLFYVDGWADKNTLAATRNFSASSLQLELAVAELESLDPNKYTAEIAFIVTLLEQWLAAQATGHEGLSSYYGLHENLASAVYLDGLIPVLQLALNNQAAFFEALSKAGEQSGLVHKNQLWGRYSVDYWVLQTKSDLGFDLWLTLVIKDNVATIALIPAILSQARRLDALGLLPEAYSLADSQSMVNIREQEGFLPYTAGFANLLEMTRLVTDPRSSKAGEDLMAVAGKQALPPVSVACRRDWLELAHNTPKLVFGYDRISLQRDTVADGHMLLQINNPTVSEALQKLNGYLPNYSLLAQDSLLSLALGIDINALMPVVSQLRRQALSTYFNCEQLIAMQSDLIAADISPLMIAAAAGQGINGVGAVLYDIDLTSITSGELVVDALISVTTEHPEMLSNLVSFIPELHGLEVPIDGTSVALGLPNLPVGLSPKLAVKGQNIVLYNGPKSADAAQQLTYEEPSKRGVFSASSNYQKLNQIAVNTVDFIAQMSLTEASECAELYANISSMHDSVDASTMRVTVEDNGIRLDFGVQVDHSARTLAPGIQDGHYRLQLLGEGCIWEPVGSEKMSADGTGQYDVLDDMGQCSLHQSQYIWQQQGRRLIYNEKTSLGRDSCSDNMQNYTLENYTCIIINASASGFDCLYNPSSEDKRLYRYVLSP
ncbi:MAG TPA: hypothetical protein DE045_01070 [Oceanospirillaceae bacterium]|nr:hypothetical protein [Oceanospirillaceae bacterium]